MSGVTVYKGLGKCKFRLGAVALSVVLAASGCAGSPVAEDPVTQVDAAADVPEFTGPWAEQLRYEFASSSAEFARLALADGVITDQELSEVQTRFASCLTDFGFTKINFSNGGAFSLSPPAKYQTSDTTSALFRESQDLVKRCRDDSGFIQVSNMYWQMRRNPTKQNEAAIIAACLVRSGAVEKGYDAQAYQNDIANNTGPINEASPDWPYWQKCNADPLGAFGG